MRLLPRRHKSAMESESQVELNPNQIVGNQSCDERLTYFQKPDQIQSHCVHTQTHCLNHQCHLPLHHLQPLDFLTNKNKVGEKIRKILTLTKPQNQINRSNEEKTFKTFVTGFALWTSFIAFSSFVLIARSTNRECTFVTRHKGFSIDSQFDLVSADLTCLSTQLLHWSYLHKTVEFKISDHSDTINY